MNSKGVQQVGVGVSGLVSIVAVVTLLSIGFDARGADHRDPPLIVGRFAVDITDFFAFRSPENYGNLVLAMPVSSGLPPRSADLFFSLPEALYQFHVDNTGDLLADTVLTVTFGPPVPGRPQEFTVRGLGAPIVGQTTPLAAGEPNVVEVDGVKLFAGPRDDPFFNDFVGRTRFIAQPFPLVPGNGLRPVGESPIRGGGTNVLAIVIELPITRVTGEATPDRGAISAWGTTSLAPFERVMENPNLVNQWNRWAADQEARDADPNDWSAFRDHMLARGAPDPGDSPLTFSQVDRAGAPLAHALIPPAMRTAFNRESPENDIPKFHGAAVASINALRERVEPFLPPADGPDVSAEVAASMFIPYVLAADFSRPLRFPAGRHPAEDVVDAVLGVQLNRGDVLGGGPGLSDAIDANDVPFLDTFPYLAPPH